MIRRLLLLLLFACALPAFGQYLVTAPLTAAASSCAVGTTPTACLFFSVGVNTNTAGAVLAGTFAGTFQFEASADNGTTWAAVSATPSNGGTAVSSTTAAGTWTIPAAGYSHIRIRCSAYTSGTATATLNPSNAVIASTGGGSGGVTPGTTGWPAVYTSPTAIGAQDSGVAGRAGAGVSGTDTILAADCGKRLNYKGSVAVAITLPTAITLGHANCPFKLTNKLSTNNALTVTSAGGWTINGAATLQIPLGGHAWFYVDADLATNWEADPNPPTLVAGSGITLTPSAQSLSIAASGAVVGTLFSAGWQFNTITTAAGTLFNAISGASGNSFNASEGNRTSIIPVSCTAKNLVVVTNNTNGTGTLTITLRRGTTSASMADTAITVAIASGAAAGVYSDTTHTVSINAGDLLDFSAAMGGSAQTSAQLDGVGLQCN